MNGWIPERRKRQSGADSALEAVGEVQRPQDSRREVTCHSKQRMSLRLWLAFSGALHNDQVWLMQCPRNFAFEVDCFRKL